MRINTLLAHADPPSGLTSRSNVGSNLGVTGVEPNTPNVRPYNGADMRQVPIATTVNLTLATLPVNPQLKREVTAIRGVLKGLDRVERYWGSTIHWENTPVFSGAASGRGEAMEYIELILSQHTLETFWFTFQVYLGMIRDNYLDRIRNTPEAINPELKLPIAMVDARLEALLQGLGLPASEASPEKSLLALTQGRPVLCQTGGRLGAHCTLHESWVSQQDRALGEARPPIDGLDPKKSRTGMILLAMIASLVEDKPTNIRVAYSTAASRSLNHISLVKACCPALHKMLLDRALNKLKLPYPVAADLFGSTPLFGSLGAFRFGLLNLLTGSTQLSWLSVLSIFIACSFFAIPLPVRGQGRFSRPLTIEPSELEPETYAPLAKAYQDIEQSAALKQSAYDKLERQFKGKALEILKECEKELNSGLDATHRPSEQHRLYRVTLAVSTLLYLVDWYYFLRFPSNLYMLSDPTHALL